MGGDQTKISVQDYEILNDLYCYDQNNLNKKFYPLKNPYKEISIDDLKKQAGFKNIFVNAYQAFKAEFLLKRKNEENEILKKELINSENSKHELKNEIEYLKSMLNLKEKEINNKIEQEEMIYKSKIYEIEAKIKTDYRITEKDNYCFKNLNSYDMVIAVTSLNDLKVS